MIHNPQDAKKIASLQPGSILRISGTPQLSEQAELGVEIIDPSVEIEVPITDPPPLNIISLIYRMI